MKTFVVNYNAGNQRGLSTYVEAKTSGDAKRVAMANIMGQAGYAGMKITIISVREVR